jgi:hypothetical protein
MTKNHPPGPTKYDHAKKATTSFWCFGFFLWACVLFAHFRSFLSSNSGSINNSFEQL